MVDEVGVSVCIGTLLGMLGMKSQFIQVEVGWSLNLDSANCMRSIPGLS